jgi:hypothetical protein
MTGHGQTAKTQTARLRSPKPTSYMTTSIRITVKSCPRTPSRHKKDEAFCTKGNSQEKEVKRHKKSQTNDASTRVGD